MTENETSALISFFLGILLLAWRGSRKFSRLNSNGIEQFPSYVSKGIAQTFDYSLFGFGVALLASSAALLLLFEQQLLVPFLISAVIVFQFRR